MPYPVRYRCPRCGTIVTLQREGYLADKSITPYPLEGWTYDDADAAVADDAAVDRFDDADGGERTEGSRASSDERGESDGIRIVCGEGESDGEGCGEPFYLSFVRFEDGREVEPEPETRRVELAPDRPRWPGGLGR